MADSLSQDDLEQIRQLLKLVEENGLTALKVSQPDGFTVDIQSDGHGGESHAAQAYNLPRMRPHPAPAAARANGAANVPIAPRGVALEAPMVGTFYRAQTPEDPPFVREGEMIQVGQTIGLIEAMKVFSEIPAEKAGRVISFAVTNGELVQLGQPLAFIEPL